MLDITCFVYEEQPTKMSLTLSWPFNVILGRILWRKLKGHIYMTNYSYFIQTLTILCTVSEILTEIDNKGLNWTFLTFRVIPYLSYFRTGLVSQQRSYMMQILAELHYYWIMAIIMGQWAKPDLSYLETDLLNNSMKSISWQLINIIPRSYIQEIKKSYKGVFEKIGK